MKVIHRLLIDQVGQIYRENGQIETMVVNGEMAAVVWYRQGNRDFNGKYVIEVEYVDEPECKCSCHIKGLNGTHHEENCLCHDSDSVTKGRIL